MKIGIIGCGRMAGKFAKTLMQMKEAECYAAASRSQERAEEFAHEYGFKKAYGSYEELCADPEVELVYIATPHSCHYENMELCIRHKKPVLCEKSFTLNAGEARKIRELAEKEQVFVSEAIWTRYMPSRDMIREIMDSGIVGNISTLTANLSYPVTHKERIMRPELAGGALLDVGVYGLNFALMNFGTDIERIESSVRMTETGVDGMESITIFSAADAWQCSRMISTADQTGKGSFTAKRDISSWRILIIRSVSLSMIQKTDSCKRRMFRIRSADMNMK